jgi:hypothetical protein
MWQMGENAEETVEEISVRMKVRSKKDSLRMRERRKKDRMKLSGMRSRRRAGRMMA